MSQSTSSILYLIAMADICSQKWEIKIYRPSRQQAQKCSQDVATLIIMGLGTQPISA